MISSKRRFSRLATGAAAGLAVLLVPAGTFTAAGAATNVNPVTNLAVVKTPLPDPGELTFTFTGSTTPGVDYYDGYVYGPGIDEYFQIDADEPLTLDVETIPGAPVFIEVYAVIDDDLETEENEYSESDPAYFRASSLGEGEKLTYNDTVGNNFFFEIAWLSSLGITTGYDDGSFRPAQPVLREQMAAFLFRAFDVDDEFEGGYEAPSVSPFKDVPTTATFYREIAWLAEEGISTGYSNGDGTRSFAPSQPVLREQFAAFIYRATNTDYSHGLDPASFTDTPRSSVFFDEIEWLALTELTTGYQEANGTLTFRGAQPVLREQMAAFLYRANSLYFGPTTLIAELQLGEGAPADNNG